MNAWPTSGPVIDRSSHQAREASSSRASRAASATALREREEHLLDAVARGNAGPVAQLGEGPLPHGFPIGEEHETVAGAARIDQLMDGEEKGPAARGFLPQE